MQCVPISPATVHFVLAHISPLEGPLPPHLLSRPLLQRHHFLGITSENAASYLAWPSSEQSHVVELLQNQPVPSHEEHLIIQYTADAENLMAHVRITPDLRLLFLWDNHDGWQYHNVATMPFPSNSYTEFSDAFAAYSPDDFLQEPAYTVNITEDNGDDDSYWNAYGHGDDDVDRPSVPRSAKETSLNSEDAYWAQYSAVHGSGDSTLPSPRRPESKKLAPDTDTATAEPERIIVPSDDFQLHHVEPYNPLEPPAPDSLARRLAALQTETGSTSPPLFDESPTSDSYTNSPHLTEVIPVPEDTSSTDAPPHTHTFAVIDPINTTNDVEDPSLDVLRESFKGFYRLWKLGRQETSAEEDKQLFIGAFTQVMEQL